MTLSEVVKGGWTKRAVVMVFLLALSVVLSACVGYHMITKDEKPSTYAAKSNKATLIIIRATKWSGNRGLTIGPGQVVTNYLDGKMIGQTRGKSYFVTEVKPGAHYVMAQAQNTAVARIRFEAGRIYILSQLLFPGFNRPTTGFVPMSSEDFSKEYTDADFLVYDTAHPGDDMPANEYQEQRDDFEKEAKEDPGRHKDTLNYRGYARLR
ncbi:MAG TPA: hypothetical protein VF903_12795 [Nitrospirota bacterium]